MAAFWQGAGATLSNIGGIASSVARRVGGIAWGTAKVAGRTGKVAWKIPKAIRSVGRLALGPAAWGMAAGGKSSNLLGALGRRALGPGIVLGGFGLMAGAKALTGGAYSTKGPNVAWGYTPGMNSPYESVPMSFSADNRFSQDMGVSGALAFALHNRRKS